jgi:flavin-dependent dehydrogenase
LFGITNPFGLGWHLDRTSFDDILREAVSVTGKDRYVKGRFTSANKKDGAWAISVVDSNSGEEIGYRAKWLIDASGRKASVAHKVCFRVLGVTLSSYLIVAWG